MDKELAEKTAFFDLLDSLDDDEDFDEAEQARRDHQRCFFSPRNPPIPATLTESRPTKRVSLRTPRKEQRSRTHDPIESVHSAAQDSSGRVVRNTPAGDFTLEEWRERWLSAGDKETIIVDETPTVDSMRQASRRPSRSRPVRKPRLDPIVDSSTVMSTSSTGMKKRRREVPFKMRPENEQIFKGLSFYYIPDSDIAYHRRVRITKARENGATWTRTPDTATHIIVDKDLLYKSVQDVITGLDQRPLPKVVNENYPLDCIQLRRILEPNQRIYHLRGQPTDDIISSSASKAPPSSKELTRSLQLKSPPNNPKRWDYIAPPGTPSRSEESSQRSRVAQIPSTDPQAPASDKEQTAKSLHYVASSKDLNGKRLTRSINHAEGHTGETSREAKDELSEYITMMQEYKDVPIDVEDEDDDITTADLDLNVSDEEKSSEEERVRKRKSTRQGAGSKGLSFEDRFACNSAGPQNVGAGNPNMRTIEVLQQMATYYDRINDHWRTTAYRKVISTLKRQDSKITTAEEAFRLPNIGQRLAQKIEEIVTTDRLKRLEYAQSEPMSDSLQLFTQIYGVGNVQAQQWVQKGFRTLEDLKEKAKLTQNQLIGVEHYDDLNTRIPRHEVKALGSVVSKAGAAIDPTVELIIGGSYRRGAETSGDIDLIITKPGTQSTTELRTFLDELVSRLESTGFLVARLASSRSAHEGSKWHGCCVLPEIKGGGVNDGGGEGYRPIWRRIDFLLVPETEIGAALIYFTGNDIFNRSMRLLASKKGMRLNQRGLYRDVMRGPGRAKLNEGQLVEGKDERRIFEILDVKWREPHERWC